MLFIKYLWNETIAKMFILPIIIMAISYLYLLELYNEDALLGVLVPLWMMVFGALTFAMVYFGTMLYNSLYESVWEEGYMVYKRKLDLPSNNAQEELEKVEKILKRHIVEYDARENNSNAKRLYDEYQIILALTDGIEVAEDIDIWGGLYGRVLKDRRDLT